MKFYYLIKSLFQMTYIHVHEKIMGGAQGYEIKDGKLTIYRKKKSIEEIRDFFNR